MSRLYYPPPLKPIPVPVKDRLPMLFSDSTIWTPEMMVVVLENVPQRLHGRLAIWLTEIHAGVYVGECSARMREHIWIQVQEEIGDGNAVMVWKADNGTDFNCFTFGAARCIPAEID